MGTYAMTGGATGIGAALKEQLRAVLETEPIVLPPWDPMGALAR